MELSLFCTCEFFSNGFSPSNWILFFFLSTSFPFVPFLKNLLAVKKGIFCWTKLYLLFVFNLLNLLRCICRGPFFFLQFSLSPVSQNLSMATNICEKYLVEGNFAFSLYFCFCCNTSFLPFLSLFFSLYFFVCWKCSKSKQWCVDICVASEWLRLLDDITNTIFFNSQQQTHTQSSQTARLCQCNCIWNCIHQMMKLGNHQYIYGSVYGYLCMKSTYNIYANHGKRYRRVIVSWKPVYCTFNNCACIRHLQSSVIVYAHT